MNFRSEQWGNVLVEKARYHNGNLAILLKLESGEPLARLSVNLPGNSELLCENEFFAKIYSENETIAREALASGLFEDTQITVGDFPVWKILPSI